ncbi:helix-turn-helix domain-containing protein [Pseudomonas sp. dw_358]|uniref:helix-turn-helix domain-containing protein n=1 Tax=Pseudomonas sp. dw_358 TaxID=2720083 RepID=UPI001BD4B7EB|nr:helix-turn-helix domain-containing protein [Pseudomonas sp. dw_358]
MKANGYVHFPKSLMHASHWKSRTTGVLIALTHMQKNLWLHIKDRYEFFTGRGTTWFESQETIAEAINCSRDSVVEFLKALEQHGYLQVTRTPVRGSQQQNTYVILADLEVTHVPRAAKKAAPVPTVPEVPEVPVIHAPATPVAPAPMIPASTPFDSEFEDDPFANVSVLPTREAA